MESTVHKIRKLYPEMGRAEKKIADYILEHLDVIGLRTSTAETLPIAR